MPPSIVHEAILALFKNRPSLAPEVLRDALGVPLPPFDEARIESADLTQVTPVEYAADLVVLLVRGTPVLGIVVEVQLERDDDKPWTWPYYVAALRAHLRSPTLLLVVCPDPKVARWASRPIPLGGSGSVVSPYVLAPASVPVVADPDAAMAVPELAVLSAMAHGRGPHGAKVGRAAGPALASLDDPRALLYTDLVLAALGPAARKALEKLMSTGNYEYQSDFARKYYGQGKAEGEAKGKAEGKAEGEAKGKAEAIIAVLRARGLEVGAETEAAVRACSDHDQLDRWLRLAATASSADDILA